MGMIINIPDIPINKNLIRSLTHAGYFKQIARLRGVFDKAVMVGKNMSRWPVDFHDPPKKLVLRITVYKKQRGGRLPDSANYIDELLDSLVRMKILHDDSDKWCRILRIDIKRFSWNVTKIVLEDIVEVVG